MGLGRTGASSWALSALAAGLALLILAPSAFASEEDPGIISGTVIEQGKTTGLEHVGIVALKIGTGEAVESTTETTADSGGKYSLGLPNGKYKLEFKPGPGENYLSQFYEQKQTLASAKEFTVASSQIEKNIDAELQAGGEISGTVTSAYTHKGLAGIEVFVDNTSAGAGELGGEEREATTNAAGEYTIVGLTSGNYTIEFQDKAKHEYISQPYPSLVKIIQAAATTGIGVTMVLKAPVNTAVPLASGTPAVGHALSCSTGSWTGEPTLAYTYQWLRNGTAIAGANGTIYGVQASDRGAGLSCKVTATNKSGSTSVVSNTLRVPAPPPAKPKPKPRPRPVVTPVVTLLTNRILAVGNSALVPLDCVNATCRGTIELTRRIVIRHRRRGRTILRRRTVILGEGSYVLAAGHSATVLVHLNVMGRRTLARARHHRLRIRVIAFVAGGPRTQELAVISRIGRRGR